jgi:hypothetical protein
MASRTTDSTRVDRLKDALAAESPRCEEGGARPAGPVGSFEEGHARRAQRLKELVEASRRTIEESRLLRSFFKKVR